MKRSERRYKTSLLKIQRWKYVEKQLKEDVEVHRQRRWGLHYSRPWYRTEEDVKNLIHLAMSDPWIIHVKKHGYCGDKYCDWCSGNKTYQSRKERARLADEEYYYLGDGERLDCRKQDNSHHYNYFLPTDFEETYFERVAKYGFRGLSG